MVLAGPNGAGKTTASRRLLVGELGVQEFVNADIIAQGISSFNPEAVAIQAGRVMLERLRQLTEQKVDVAFETTLASRSFAPMIKRLSTEGYRCHLMFLWLPTPDMAVDRVRQRVVSGGHNIPEEVIRRRYEAGLNNFFRIYSAIVTKWEFYDNSDPTHPRELARGSMAGPTVVSDPSLWKNIDGKWK